MCWGAIIIALVSAREEVLGSPARARRPSRERAGSFPCGKGETSFCEGLMFASRFCRDWRVSLGCFFCLLCWWTMVRDLWWKISHRPPPPVKPRAYAVLCSIHGVGKVVGCSRRDRAHHHAQDIYIPGIYILYIYIIYITGIYYIYYMYYILRLESFAGWDLYDKAVAQRL